MNGVARPLETLTTAHQLLDVVEAMAIKSKAHEGGDALQRFLYELYKPDTYEVQRQIETADTDADFDAFAALGMG